MDQNENSPWEYKPDGGAEAPETQETSAESPAPQPKSAAGFAWQAPEFIEHPHPASWYALLTLITAALTVGVYFLTKDFVATGTIPVVGIIVAVFASHKAGLAQYELSSSGLKINGKNYPFGLFKSFSLLQEGNYTSINMFPLKRFMPPVSAYFEPKDEDTVTDLLGDRLPYEQHQMDGIERLSRRLRL